MDSNPLTQQILAKEHSLQDILANKKYSVDYFQREYKWEKDTISPLRQPM